MLKTYQKEALATLSRFCDLSKQKPITEAFRSLTGNQYLEVDGSTAPYVCLRVPTGGGKTLIATKSLRILSNDYLEQPYHLVLWLAPSDKIVTQTLEVLKDKRNFYRSLLDKDFDNIKVLSMQEAYRQKFDPSEELVIVVGTIQSFRTNSKEGRKFYAENANYYEMLKHRDITPSMENVMKMVKPIIVLDEAHKSRTSLSLENLLGLDPSFILELTATPVTQSSKAKKVYASNILYTVNAIALKRESMIKLPIMLKTLDDTRLILQEGILRRNYLEELAKLEERISERYIRPINLIRADENRGEDAFTYDKIRETLLEMGIQEEEIAIQTGKLKEIDGVELLSRNCPIRYIITVDALKEGWDCPFAYVLSVVSQMESNTAIEQLIGRVLRMPYTEEKNKEELGYSYVYVASKNFESVAQSIGNTLIKNGFEAFEAKISIDNSANTNETIDELGGLFGERVFEEQQVYVGSEIDLEVLSKPSIAPYTNHNSETGNLSIIKFPSPSKREAFSKTLKSIVPSEKHEEIDAIMKSVEKLNPQLLDKVSDFSLPYLMMEDEGELVRFEESAILEYISIETADIITNASLSQEEFNIDLKEQVGKIDISDRTNQVTKETINDEGTLFKDELTNSIMEHQYGGYKSNAIAKKLGIEIAKLIVKEDNSVLKVLDSMALNEFIYLTLSRLESERGLEMQSLVTKKYQLKRAILQKLHEMINSLKIGTFNTLLETKSFRLSNEHVLEFLPNSYQPNPDSRSSQFKKHHYQYVDKFDSYKAEYEVAQYIDGLDEVISWVRNIAKDAQNAFWLQTSNYKFYPDFIIKLANGKTVVAEYKGDMLKTTDDTKEKELIGNLWASKSDKYEFLMLYEKDYKTKLQSILER